MTSTQLLVNAMGVEAARHICQLVNVIRSWTPHCSFYLGALERFREWVRWVSAYQRPASQFACLGGGTSNTALSPVHCTMCGVWESWGSHTPLCYVPGYGAHVTEDTHKSGKFAAGSGRLELVVDQKFR